jgi:hypothetical protein
VAAQTERYLRSLSIENERIVDALTVCEDREHFRELLLELHRRVNDASRAPYRLTRVSVLGSTLGRPDLAAAVGRAQDQFIHSFSNFIAAAKERGWTRPDLDPVGASAWAMGQILGRVIIEIGESSVTDEQWAVASETALLAVMLGET